MDELIEIMKGIQFMINIITIIQISIWLFIFLAAVTFVIESNSRR